MIDTNIKTHLVFIVILGTVRYLDPLHALIMSKSTANLFPQSQLCQFLLPFAQCIILEEIGACILTDSILFFLFNMASFFKRRLYIAVSHHSVAGPNLTHFNGHSLLDCAESIQSVKQFHFAFASFGVAHYVESKQ